MGTSVRVDALPYTCKVLGDTFRAQNKTVEPDSAYLQICMHTFWNKFKLLLSCVYDMYSRYPNATEHMEIREKL